METLISILTNNALLTAFGPIAIVCGIGWFLARRDATSAQAKNDTLNDQRVSDAKESSAKYEALVEKIRETLQKLIPGNK